MKIVVLMKQVPNKDAILRVNKEEKWVEEGDLSFEVSESDGYALEEALRLKEKKGGEVVVCSLGPQRVKSVIKDALAIRGEQADLVLTGLQSDDYGYGQTGVIMAELLGLPHATIVIEVDYSGERLRVKRELESGWYQWDMM